MPEVHAENPYHLPANYNDNKVTLLARDPNWLYAYWDVSNESRENFLQEFGSDMWEKSVPVLKIVNVSRNTTSDIRINDFSNSWYVHVDGPDCLYTAEIGRVVSERFFINFANSNYVATPANNFSNNSTVYFIDYRSLRKGKLELDAGRIYETYEHQKHFESFIGLSSPELFGSNMHESLLGLSSPELFGVNIKGYLGISSTSIMKKTGE